MNIYKTDFSIALITLLSFKVYVYKRSVNSWKKIYFVFGYSTSIHLCYTFNIVFISVNIECLFLQFGVELLLFEIEVYDKLQKHNYILFYIWKVGYLFF